MWECNELQPPVELRSDIENVWTFAIFFIPSCLAVAALLAQYVVLHMPLSQIASWDINAVDVVVLRCARGALKHISFDFTHLDRPSKDGDLRAMLDQFMLSLGDIHIGFAIAIIGYGFSSLSRGVTAYEWWIMVGLGWLAIVTNIAVTCFLRDFHRKYPVKRGWRICLIFAMVALLGVCMVPIVRIKQAMSHQSQQSRNDILLVNAMCFFPGRGHVFPSEGHAQLLSRLCILVGSLVVVGILTVAVTILERPGSILRKWCELYRGDVHESSTRDQLICARCEQRFVLLAMRPFVALWLTARTHLELLNSVLAENIFTATMLSWVTLRLLQLLQLQPLYAAETTLEFAHLIALVTLLAPFKSFVEYAWTSCRASHGLKRFKVGLLRREPEPLLSPASESNEAPAGEGRTIACETAAPVTRNEGSTGQSRLRYRRRMDLTAPLHLNFYLDTVWYVEALPIAGMSALAQVVLMVALAITGKDPTTVVVLQLVPWYVLFTPVQVLLFVLCAMITEERGGTTGSKKKIYWGLSAMFGLISIVAALDTIYGIGGIPMSYISMATTGLMIIAYALYGCISKPGKHVKGKGTNSGEIDEESALLGSKVQVRIPIRRPKYLHGPSRRLSKQSIKNYGTMAAKPLGGVNTNN